MSVLFYAARGTGDTMVAAITSLSVLAPGYRKGTTPSSRPPPRQPTVHLTDKIMAAGSKWNCVRNKNNNNPHDDENVVRR